MRGASVAAAAILFAACLVGSARAFDAQSLLVDVLEGGSPTGAFNEAVAQVPSYLLQAQIPPEVNQTIEAIREAIIQADIDAPFLETGIPNNVNDTINALREELFPVVEDLWESAGVPRQCIQDAYNIASGCSSDVVALAEQEREAVLSRVGVNPLMYFQPTSWSVLSALNETVSGYAANGVDWRVGQTCCDHLSSLTAGGCLCDPDIVSFLASITGQGFLDALRTTYSNSCVSNGTLALYPSADC